MNRCIDHKGRIYRSFTHMCTAWGKDRSLVLGRIHRGLSLQEALETPVTYQAIKGKDSTDHTGQTFPSFTRMCVAWGKNRVTVQGRLRAGYSLEEALTLPLGHKPGDMA